MSSQVEEEKHFHVLAVDDSLIDRKLLERLFKVSSYQVLIILTLEEKTGNCAVTCVESGNKALEYLGLNGIDSDTDPNISSSSSSSLSSQQKGAKVNLIMTDYCMPGMSGYDLLKRVKGSSWKDVPVVVMSSENVPSRVNMCLEGGAEEFLLKPLQLSDVKKLQPYLLKSLEHSYKSINKGLDNKSDDTGRSNKEDQSTKSNSNDHTSTTKRKAVSPEPSQKRPKKMKHAV